MYGITTTLPMTGPSLLGFAIIGGALLASGLISLRLAYFARRARTARVMGTPPADLPPAGGSDL